MKKNIIILILCALMVGCQPPEYADSYVTPREIKKNNKSMVITKITVPYTSVLKQNGHFHASMVIRKVTNSLKYKINGASYDESASMIEPGKYQIESVTWNDGLYIYNLDIPDIEAHKLNYMLGGFEIKPGECLYLGDISVNKSAKVYANPLKIVDNKDQMLIQLQDQDLQALKSRITFYPLLTNKP